MLGGGRAQVHPSARAACQGGPSLAVARRPSEERNVNVLLPQTPSDAYVLGYADGFRGDPPVRLYTWDTQDAYSAGYRAGQRSR